MVSLFRHRPLSSFLLLALLSPSVGTHAAGNVFTETMTVATTIDKNAFYTAEIKVYFEEETVYPKASGQKLQNTTTGLVVEMTNFSASDALNLNHVLYLTENITTCREYDIYNVLTEIPESEAVYPNYKTTFVRTYINEVKPDNELTEDKPLGPLEFKETDPTGQIRYTRYPFTLVFKDLLPKPEAAVCSGEIEVMVEFDG